MLCEGAVLTIGRSCDDISQHSLLGHPSTAGQFNS